jgi:hypothetical protein
MVAARRRGWTAAGVGAEAAAGSHVADLTGGRTGTSTCPRVSETGACSCKFYDLPSKAIEWLINAGMNYDYATQLLINKHQFMIRYPAILETVLFIMTGGIHSSFSVFT